MRARDRGKDGDDDEEDCARRNGVAKQRDRLIPAGKLLGHDAGADDRHDQDQRAERLSREPASHIELHSPPPLLSLTGQSSNPCVR